MLTTNEDCYILFARLAQVKRLLLISFLKIWNGLDNNQFKISMNKLEFNYKLKSHFLDFLNDNYVCTRLLCPNCHLNVNVNPMPDVYRLNLSVFPYTIYFFEMMNFMYSER
jgi:hypothetical protein